jgi:hypothetical protein
MGRIKGQTQYEKFLRGERLSWKQAGLAKCYQCNGFEEGNIDCNVPKCPLYQHRWGRRDLVGG